jgi:hypothetical protein
MTSHAGRVRALFDAARARPAHEREAWLSGGDHDDGVVSEVRELLAFSLRPDGPLDTPVLDADLVAAARDGAAPDTMPERVGPYVLVRTLGRGGAGTVYEALQENPRRTVALKLLREGMATDSALSRFQLEVDALGRLDHPYVASIYEAGTTDLGRGLRPYLAMEFVDGEPLSRAVARCDPSRAERLELLARVGEGVAHAHSRGVVHRDLKPDNVLVDEALDPRILDFGVARLLERDAGAPGHATAPGILVGTLPYMSPEQAAGDAARIDTRSDVYALGVLGYELLTGRLPYALDGLDLPDALRVITERDGPLAGTVDPALAGDVETLLAKALHKDPGRRYQSASEFVADVRRHLADEPILARPASTADQLRRFARKNRALVTGVSVGLALLFVALAAMGWGLRQARLREDANLALLAAEQQGRRAEADARRLLEAEQALTLAAQRELQAEQAVTLAAQRELQAEQALTLAAKRELERALADAETLLGFVSGTLMAVHPENDGWDVRVGDLLDAAADRVETWDATQSVRARMDETLGRAYLALGRYAPARDHLQRSFTTTRDLHGADASPTLAVQHWLGEARRSAGDVRLARELQEDRLERATRLHGADHATALEASLALGRSLHVLGELDDAEARLVLLVDRSRGILGADHELTLRACSALGGLHVSRNRYDAAHELYEGVHDARREALGDDHVDTLSALRELAFLQETRGDFAGAFESMDALHAGFARTLGPEHPETLDALSDLARSHETLGRWAEALQTYVAAIEGLTKAVGRDGGLTLLARRRHAALLLKLDRRVEARAALQALLDARAGKADNSGWVLSVRRNLGFLLMLEADFAGARREFEAALAGLRAQYDDPFVESGHVLMDLSNLDMNEGRLAAAETRLLEAEEIYRQTLGEDHEDFHSARMNRARGYALGWRHAEAEALLLGVIQHQGAALGNDHPTVLRALTWLAELWIDAGRADEAAPLLEGVVASLAPRVGATHQLVLEARWALAEAFLAQGELPQAQAALDAVASDLGSGADDAFIDQNQVVRELLLLMAQGRLDDAEELVIDCLARVEGTAFSDRRLRWELRYRLAEVFERAGRLAEAEFALGALHEAARTDWGDQSWEARRSASRLLELCATQGREPESESWREALGEGGPVPRGFVGR